MGRFNSDTEVEFTVDMAETLLKYFEVYAVDGVVTVVKDDVGLWLVSAESRAFLGLARPPKRPKRRLN